MNRSRYIIGILLVVSAILFYQFYWIDENKEISLAIQQEIQQKETVDLGQLVDGEWDSVICVTPYTNKAEVNNKFNVDVGRIRDFSIEQLDDRILLIFCKDNQVEKYVYLPNRMIAMDDEPLNSSLQMKRENAHLTLG